MKIALFGTGRLGSGMAERWLKGGNTVCVWNRTAGKARALEAFGAKAFEDPLAALEGADIVHIIVSDDAAVDGLLDRIVERIPRGTLVIDHTTTSPAGAAARSARGDKAGIEFLHAPVFMSPQAVREGTGLMLVCGPAERVKKAGDHLKKMTGEVWNVGEDPRHAAAFKLFGNAMIVTIVSGLSDVYAMARSVGVDPRDAHSLFSHFKASNSIDIRGKKMAAGDFAPSFELTMARKDVRLMNEMADRGDVELHILPAIAERIDELIAKGLGDRDLGVMAIDAVSEAAVAG
ncbi:MAG TPA: NAD(P)-dependent oxidoreductase [Candidatus Acidoferrales bacterium]|nr:NAD(P)-dependent oxidoreductase [Candidatus Acidoferrales bacterium]